jgi:hypothetical protein
VYLFSNKETFKVFNFSSLQLPMFCSLFSSAGSFCAFQAGKHEKKSKTRELSSRSSSVQNHTNNEGSSDRKYILCNHNEEHEESSPPRGKAGEKRFHGHHRQLTRNNHASLQHKHIHGSHKDLKRFAFMAPSSSSVALNQSVELEDIVIDDGSMELLHKTYSFPLSGAGHLCAFAGSSPCVVVRVLYTNKILV